MKIVTFPQELKEFLRNLGGSLLSRHMNSTGRGNTSMVIRIMPPLSCPLWDLADVIKLKLLRWRDYLDYSGGPV